MNQILPNLKSRIFSRVDIVGTIHNNLLTQWRHIPMGRFHVNTFFIWTTSDYYGPQKFLKNRVLKVNEASTTSVALKRLLSFMSWKHMCFQTFIYCKIGITNIAFRNNSNPLDYMLEYICCGLQIISQILRSEII